MLMARSGKDYTLPPPDAKALQVAWSGSNGYAYNTADPLLRYS